MSPPALERLVRQCLSQKNPDDPLAEPPVICAARWKWIGVEAVAVHDCGQPAAPRDRGARRMAWIAAGFIGVVAGCLRGDCLSQDPGHAPNTNARIHAVLLHVFAPMTQFSMPPFAARTERPSCSAAALEGNVPPLFVIRPENPDPQPFRRYRERHCLRFRSTGEPPF
jgi:hypothetical protein